MNKTFAIPTQMSISQNQNILRMITTTNMMMTIISMILAMAAAAYGNQTWRLPTCDSSTNHCTRHLRSDILQGWVKGRKKGREKRGDIGKQRRKSDGKNNINGGGETIEWCGHKDDFWLDSLFCNIVLVLVQSCLKNIFGIFFRDGSGWLPKRIIFWQNSKRPLPPPPPQSHKKRKLSG